MAALPDLVSEYALDDACAAYLERLAESSFAGDIDTTYATRITLATDNSAFQQLPAAALFPRDAADIQRALALLAEPAFANVFIAPRGGGTSTIGCSLTTGVVLDCSRYMNRIQKIDPEAGVVTVEPGVVLDQLNDVLAAHGVCFAPNVAPSNRATLGGMANTDGCGRGSRVHGKTSDHVRALDVVLTDGSRHVIRAVPAADPAGSADPGLEAVVGAVVDVVQDNAAEIERVFPSLSRYLSGYNLAQAMGEAGEVNLCKLVCGSEGTLAVVSGLTLALTPLADTRALFALRYDSFDAALRDAQTLVDYRPSAIETVDNVIMGLARDNPIYARVRAMIENADGSTPAALNLVEFAGVGALPAEADALGEALTAGTGHAAGFYRADAAPEQAALWELRKSGVGLLGSAPGVRKPLPFVEDTVVDPRVLADYVADFRAILDEYGLSYGMFGHVDVGCLHVRPALDLTDPGDEAIMRAITARVAKLAESYGGLLWNEHGKGFRSEYNRAFFGETLYAALARIKRAFDPRNQLNPGKIVALDAARVPLAGMDAPTHGAFDRVIPASERAAFAPALDCNGNGACFDYDADHVMCPSYRGTRDRLHSPKGRAAAMREWLRQLALRERSATELAVADGPLALRALADQRGARGQPLDFSHQVWQAMDGCLSCRACASQCPVKVDVPTFKSRFLAAYHARYPRPPADYAFAGLETGAAVAARAPGLANRLTRHPVVRRLLAERVGLADPPPLSQPPLARYLRAHPEYAFSDAAYAALAPTERARVVFVVQDAFTSFFDAPVVRAALAAIAALGYRPMVLPFKPGGKALQVKGFLPEFARAARRQAEFLSGIARYGRPLVGIDPSVTQMYASEYGDVAGLSMPAVQRLEHWLAAALVPDGASSTAKAGQPTHALFQHCTPAATEPASAADWQAAFAAVGLSLATVELGCCGMSGAYGHEQRHRATSHAIFELSWARAYARADASPVVPGYSCRSQLRRFAGAAPQHPVEAILEAVAPKASRAHK